MFASNFTERKYKLFTHNYTVIYYIVCVLN